MDYDLAVLYGYKAKALNQQVKRNIARFPEDFMFQLTKDEVVAVKSQIVTSPNSSFFAGQEGGGAEHLRWLLPSKEYICLQLS